jgi:hypothetical protein
MTEAAAPVTTPVEEEAAVEAAVAEAAAPAPAPSAAQSQSKKPPAAVFRLDGIQKTNETTKGVDVKVELQRIWDHMSKKKAAPDSTDDNEELIPGKDILYKDNKLMADKHPAFVGNEASRYINAMTLVAMSFGDDEWRKFLSFDLDDRAKRNLFDSVQKKTKLTILELEVQAGVREANSQSKAKAGLCSLGDRFRTACNNWKKQGMSDRDIDQYVNRKVFGEERGQRTIPRSYIVEKQN